MISKEDNLLGGGTWFCIGGDGDTMVRLKCKMDVTKNLNDLTGFNQDVEPKNKTLQ